MLTSIRGMQGKKVERIQRTKETNIFIIDFNMDHDLGMKYNV